MALNPLVTVIIPVYNTDRYLEKCLYSVINQTYKNLLIVVVNDGSTDSSDIIIDDFVEKDNRIIAFSQKNGGASSARNLGLENVNGKYVTFLDSDDWWEKDTIENLVCVAETNDYDIIIPQKYIKVSKNGDKKVENVFDSLDITSDALEFTIKTMIAKSRAWRVSSVLYKSVIIQNYGIRFPDGYTAEDFVFNLDYLEKVKKIGFLEKITLNVNKRNDSVTSSYRNDLPELSLYLDNVVEKFYKNMDINDEKSQVAKNSLLCRNIIIFLVIETSSINEKTEVEKYKRIKEVLSNKRIEDAFSDKKFISPYWNSKTKIVFVVFLRKLIHLKLHGLAIMFAKLANNLTVN